MAALETIASQRRTGSPRHTSLSSAATTNQALSQPTADGNHVARRRRRDLETSMGSAQSPFSRGRDDNNIGFLRLLGAFMVLFGHNWVLYYGAGVQRDPVSLWIAQWQLSHEVIHGIGINLFFVLSGFLISKSYCSGYGVVRFCVARAMRIYPALIVTVLLTALALGPIMTSLPLSEYLSSEATWKYIRDNATLNRIIYTLPGMFADNPFPNVANGSLWSLPLEMKMYGFALIFGLLAFYKRKVAGLLLLITITAIYFSVAELQGKELVFNKGLFMVVLHFMLGMACFMYRDHIPLHLWIAAALYAPVILLPRGLAFEISSSIAFTYLVLLLAYSPKIRLPKVERFGDLSYGLYLYAFPVQQVLVYAQVGSVWTVLILASVITLMFALFSWHLIEQPALGRTSAAANYIQLRLQRLRSSPVRS